jgi:hypothetical protein
LDKLRADHWLHVPVRNVDDKAGNDLSTFVPSSPLHLSEFLDAELAIMSGMVVFRQILLSLMFAILAVAVVKFAIWAMTL